MSTYNFTIETATKESVPPLIALWGQSGTGKTLSALKLARGIVGENGKIVLIDTENKRAKFYADECGKWFHVDIQPPFTPEKYSAAFKFAEDNKADIIIVDSMSHVWEGEGGVLDMADNAKSAKGYELKGLAKWKAPKTQYKRMINNLLRAPIPVIFCVRAKEKFVQEKDDRGNDVLRSDGQTPIMDKNFVFEMTLSLKMEENGRFSKASKIPNFLTKSLPVGEQVSEKMGKSIMDVLGKPSIEQLDLIKLKRDALDVSHEGMSALEQWFNGLTVEAKKAIKPYITELKNKPIQEEGEIEL